MTLNAKPLSIIIVAILFGSVTLANVIGRWDTELNHQEVDTEKENFFASRLTPADITETYTFGDIDRFFNIPTPVLAKAFELPDETNITAFSIEELYTSYAEKDVEIGISSVRVFVALYSGLHYETAEQIYLPISAVDVLLSRHVLLPDQVEFMDSYAHVLDPMPALVSATANRNDTAERAIKGKTTFQEILDWGISHATIEQIIGEPIPSPHRIVKDYCTEKGLDFEETKLALEEEANKQEHEH